MSTAARIERHQIAVIPKTKDEDVRVFLWDSGQSQSVEIRIYGAYYGEPERIWTNKGLVGIRAEIVPELIKALQAAQKRGRK
jgi:hypothetical protein